MKKTLFTKAADIIKSTTTSQYHITVNVTGTTYEASGDTIDEALAQILPPKMNTKAVFTISKGSLTKTFHVNAPRLRRLLGNANTRAIWAIQLERIFR